MAMGISTPAQYAIRALVCLACRGTLANVPIREIADSEDIPYPFLAKLVAAQLVQVGLLDSFRGPNGGVRLAKPAHRIMVLDVIQSIDGADFTTQCFLGLPNCSDDDPCPAHETWKSLRDPMALRLGSASIADLALVVEARRERR